MTYAALTNWKYDKNLYHNIQSGPQRTEDTLDLTDTYKLVSSGYRMPNGEQQSYYTVLDAGPNFGIITPGPPMTFASEVNQPTYPENKTIKVTVANTSAGNRYFFDGVENTNFFIFEGSTYTFDISDISNGPHPFQLSLTADGTHAGGTLLTDGVTYSGTPGTPGAFVRVIGQLSPTEVIYPYCQIHPNMGGTTNFPYGGIPTNRPLYQTRNWRTVPPAVPGFWTNYNFYVNPQVSGELNVQDGFRYQNLYHVANAEVQTAIGPQPGLRDRGAYTWWNNAVPDNQAYQPFETPPNDGTQNNSTGGPGTYPRAQFPMLTNPTQDGSGSRAPWVYNAPVYCETYTETIRSTVPGAMSSTIRRMYRGRSSRYVYNYGATYGVIGEAARNIVRSYSPGVNGGGVTGV